MESLSQTTDFYGQLAQGVLGLMNDILKENGLSLFRRSTQVELASPQGNGAIFQLHLVGKSECEDSKGTFSINIPNDRVMVFRNPTKVSVSFILTGTGVSVDQRMRAWDKLSTYFFDNKTVEPFLPTGFQRFPALWEKMRAQKAEFRPTAESPSPNALPLEETLFAFDYVALYHSGNPLREEKVAKQRVIEYSNDHSERSVQ